MWIKVENFLLLDDPMQNTVVELQALEQGVQSGNALFSLK